jgi:hypothetical protein
MTWERLWRAYRLGGVVSMLATVRGRLNGSFGVITGTGRSLEVRGTSVGRVAGGAIVGNRDDWNLASILRQLGVTELP